MLRENLNNMSQSIAGYLTNAITGNTQASYNDMAANGMDVPMIKKEGFENGNDNKLLKIIIAMLIQLVIFLLIGKYVFNNVLVKVVPAIKPITSVWQLLGLSILFNMLF
jgi:hypothetical protein